MLICWTVQFTPKTKNKNPNVNFHFFIYLFQFQIPASKSCMRKQKELYCKFQLKKSKMMQNKLEREKIFLGNKRDSKKAM